MDDHQIARMIVAGELVVLLDSLSSAIFREFLVRQTEDNINVDQVERSQPSRTGKSKSAGACFEKCAL
jgi:hypothetical protein